MCEGLEYTWRYNNRRDRKVPFTRQGDNSVILVLGDKGYTRGSSGATGRGIQPSPGVAVKTCMSILISSEFCICEILYYKVFVIFPINMLSWAFTDTVRTAKVLRVPTHTFPAELPTSHTCLISLSGELFLHRSQPKTTAHVCACGVRTGQPDGTGAWHNSSTQQQGENKRSTD